MLYVATWIKSYFKGNYKHAKNQDDTSTETIWLRVLQEQRLRSHSKGESWTVLSLIFFPTFPNRLASFNGDFKSSL